MMTNKILGTEDWLLEVQASEGLGREDIEVREVEKDVPQDFLRSVDRDYHGNLVQKARDIMDEGKDVQVKIGDELRPISVEDGKIFYESGEELIPGSWEERPTLFSVEEDGRTERQFWDGSTFVAKPEVEGEKLVLKDAYEGTYAERQAAVDWVGKYSIYDLPLSMNITMVTLMDRDEEKVIPIFKRNQTVAEYPGYFMTVAGGIGSPDNHPLDAGWKEMMEEIRIGPDASKGEYFERGIVSEREVETMRDGQVEGRPIYTVIGDDGQKNIYRSEGELESIGVVRNLETHAPEIIAIVDTGINYQIAEENYTRKAEHESIRPIPYTKEGVKDFLEENDKVIPVGEAGLVMATGLEEEWTQEYERDDLPRGYENFVTLTV